MKEETDKTKYFICFPKEKEYNTSKRKYYLCHDDLTRQFDWYFRKRDLNILQKHKNLDFDKNSLVVMGDIDLEEHFLTGFQNIPNLLEINSDDILGTVFGTDKWFLTKECIDRLNKNYF